MTGGYRALVIKFAESLICHFSQWETTLPNHIQMMVDSEQAQNALCSSAFFQPPFSKDADAAKLNSSVQINIPKTEVFFTC